LNNSLIIWTKDMHVFVAMPFGTKEGIDFNRIYSELIKPALEEEGFEVFRADEERRAGEIRTDMFQELLLADLVVADLSIDNPNVWYELGVRHALRARGVIQIKSIRERMPFDVSTDRTLSYHVKDGLPDPVFLSEDKATLRSMCRETVMSWYSLKISPVYHLLPFLEEPNWKKLHVGGAKEFWEKHKVWESKIRVARQKKRPGDILVLAEEGPIQALRFEAYRTAGKSLMDLGQFSLALEQIEKALSINPKDLGASQYKGILLGRMKRFESAKEWIRSIVKENPEDSETLALLGRVEKDAWIQSWRGSDRTAEQMAKDAAYEDSLLQEAIDPYLQGFMLNPTHLYSGINALTLLYLLKHLTGNNTQAEKLKALEGGIRWAIESALSKESPTFKDYWARVTLGELEVLVSDIPTIEKSYKYAIAVSENNWFALDSSRQQLLILRDLGFRPKEVEAAINVFDRALEKMKKPETRMQPKSVFLFSGHMIDAPGRTNPRFPNEQKYIDIAANAIAAKLDALGASKEDIALCGGACGGDLLFAESCLERGLHLEIRIPFEEPTFLHNSVSFAGHVWQERFYKVKSNPNTRLYVMPYEIGVGPKGRDVYARNNLWQLYTALSLRSEMTPERVHFICLWNGKEGDGPGGTKDMLDEISKHLGRAYVLDTNELFKTNKS
jgi:tetratricopeptide (TPR) repeat protein